MALLLPIGCRTETATPVERVPQATEAPAVIDADQPFNLEDLISDDPAVRRAALAALPVEEIERVPESLVPELAELIGDEAEHPDFRAMLHQLIAGGDALGALKLARQMARALDAIRAPEADPEWSGVVFGWVDFEDGAGDVQQITAPMEILESGAYAGAIGDLRAGFEFLHPRYGRAEAEYMQSIIGDWPNGGFQPPPEPRVVQSRPVILSPLQSTDRITIRGRVIVDGESPPGDLRLTAAILDDGEPNTPRGQRELRSREEHREVIFVDQDGQFMSDEFVGGRYELRATAEGFEPATETIHSDRSGNVISTTLRLIPSDLAAYGSPDGDAPPPLDWRDDHEAALAEAVEAGRPALALTHADWCAPCIRFEQTTLQSPWARAALAPFMLVRVNEDRAFNAVHEAEIYPTLIAFDGAGRELTRITGYAPAISLLRFAQRVYAGLEMEPPAALRQLMDEGVLGED